MITKYKKNWLKHIQQGKGKEIARAFFLTFTTQSELSRSLYKIQFERIVKQTKRRDWIHKTIQTYYNEWKDLDFFGYDSKQLEIKIPNKRGKGRKEHIQKYDIPYRLNLEPLFEYFEHKGIELLEEEKNSLASLFTLPPIRKEIYNQFPEEDVINAILKYYVKNFIIQYDKAKLIINKNPKRFKEMYKKFFLKIYSKKIRNKLNNWKDKTNEDLYLNAFFLKNLKEDTFCFNLYRSSKRDKPQIMNNIDFKILKALNLCSDLLMDLKEIDI